MGTGKILLIIIVLLGAIWYFYPDKFNDGREYAFEKFSELTKKAIKDTDTESILKDLGDQYNYTETDLGIDFGKILGHLSCVQDSDCDLFFNIAEMKCSTNGTCYLPLGGTDDGN